MQFLADDEVHPGQRIFGRLEHLGVGRDENDWLAGRECFDRGGEFERGLDDGDAGRLAAGNGHGGGSDR